MTAVLFPGQGSQTAGMRDLVAEIAPDLLARCLELVGADPFERVEESTRFAQPAIFCAGVANWRQAALPDGLVQATAGHSLGELAALVAADAVDDQDALKLVVTRGALMAEMREGTMAALLGADERQAQALAGAHGVTVANHNAPGQFVLSGANDAIAAVVAQARADGLKAMDLGVAGAFHSPLMAPAVPAFAGALAEVEFRPPTFPVISGATAAPMIDPRTDLAAALTAPVRWVATLHALRDRGITRFADAGPGKVLFKLVRRTLPDAEAMALVADLAAAAHA